MAEKKMVVVGEGGVGKTALIIQFVQNHFVNEYDPTIEDSYRRQINFEGSEHILEILDTAGQEEFAGMRDQYMLLGQAFMLVYSITSKPSLDGLDAFHQQIVRVKGSPKVPMILCGNKADVVDDRHVPFAEGTAKAAAFQIPFFETSAKTKQNVVEAFQELLRVFLEYEASNPKAAAKKRRGGCILL